jgi:DNA invertase Pin-like site-specific DNA recombinase
MSTESQRYSIEYQSAANAAFALEHGYEIVRTYTDSGISGLTLRRRAGLQALLTDVLAGAPGFQRVLVYDVSRWGRFQDPDESAHYEFLCRSAGVDVSYTAELFDNDGSLVASLLKHMKRAMAAEFSRELSARVSRTQRGLGAKGYWMGGPVGYGLRRQVVGVRGEPGRILHLGERIALRGERVVLVPGPPEELAVVRQIFQLFVEDGLSVREIVARLNTAGIAAADGVRWTAARVRSLLRNEAYIGVNVIGKCRHHLGLRDPQPRANWIRSEHAIAPIVPDRLFAAAQPLIRSNKPTVTEDELLAELRKALARHGRLSRSIIDRDPQTHCAVVYQSTFGSLSGAYARVGYAMSPQQRATSLAALRDKPHLRRGGCERTVSDESVLAALRAALADRGRLSREILDQIPGIPHGSAVTKRFGGAERLYEMLGYSPSERQRTAMRSRKLAAAPNAVIRARSRIPAISLPL